MSKIWYRASKQAYYLQIDRDRQKRLGKTLKEAEAAYREWLLSEGKPLPAKQEAALTVLEVGKKFLGHSRRHNKPATYQFYRYFVRPFSRRFKDAPARGFPPLTFERWLDRHPGWKGARRNAIIAIKRMFSWAVEKKLLTESPLAGVKKPAKKKRKRILSAAERELLFSSIRDRFFRDYCFALLESGARPMEVARVEANQVSQDGTMWMFEEHKTDADGTARIVYLSPALQELTKRLMRENPEGPLFRSTRKKNGKRRPWTRNGIRCRFKRLRQKHPELKGITAYSLRHSYTTHALLKGIPVAVVSALLGHKSIKMVDEHYNHTDQVTGQLKAAAARAVG